MLQTAETSTPYVCPQTRARLAGVGEELRAIEGQAAYRVEDGIADFLRFGSAEDAETRTKLERLNTLAREQGWERALRTIYADAPGMLRYVIDADRSSFLDLLPLAPERDVLEIGPGLGQFTPLLARRSRRVYALEVVPGQARFVAERCAQLGLTNVDVAAGGDDCRLPYPEASVDVVVLNLVFEWCASRCTDEAPEAVQRRLLSEMQRVLRPGGALYLATKNRFALRYLLGGRDEHAHGMRFGNALPRALGESLLAVRGQRRAPGLLHSHDALARMLREAGFDAIRSYWAAPEMRYPTHYVPTDPSTVRAVRRSPGFVPGEGRLVRRLMRAMPAALVRHVTPGLAFVATKPAG